MGGRINQAEFFNKVIDILIVCDKLLTGFDAPICQVLYIDKELKEHGLLQAIARTNRLYEGKDYGLIVDYRGLIEKLDTAMDLYSGAGLENFDSGDLKGVVVDAMSSVAGLREAYTRVTELFADLKNPRDTEEVEVFLADEKRRASFYHLLCAFGKALNLVLNAEQAYSAVPKTELKQYRDTFLFFSRVRRSTKIRYCDAIDNQEYERMVTRYLDEQCQTILGEIISETYPVFQKYGVSMPVLRIRNMETRWGSCLTKKGIITLNRRLLEVPRNCIEYVVMHEFCHFVQPNHSTRFYDFLTILMPDWRERKKTLDKSAVYWI